MDRRGWDRFDIMRALRAKQTNLTQLAVANGLDPSACKHAVRRPSLGGEIAIANALDLDPTVLWPDRYREPLTRLRSNALEAFRASQKKSRPAAHPPVSA